MFVPPRLGSGYKSGLSYNKEMQKCPKCQQTTRQNRAGRTEAGSQRYRCMHCGSKYTPEPKKQGYPDEVRKKALEMYIDGINLRRIGRHLGLHHQTVANWAKAYAAELPETPMPEEVKDAEMDELFTFIGDKKTGSTFSPS
jgi:transposase-like protein